MVQWIHGSMISPWTSSSLYWLYRNHFLHAYHRYHPPLTTSSIGYRLRHCLLRWHWHWIHLLALVQATVLIQLRAIYCDPFNLDFLAWDRNSLLCQSFLHFFLAIFNLPLLFGFRFFDFFLGCFADIFLIDYILNLNISVHTMKRIRIGT